MPGAHPRVVPTLDAVEGLDVDRDDGDKFHTRDVIARVLMELWNWDECVARSVAELGRVVDRDVVRRLRGVRPGRPDVRPSGFWTA